MRYLLAGVLALLFVAIGVQAAPVTVPVPDASFESGAAVPEGWEFLKLEGAEGQLSYVGDPLHDGQRALVIEKTNGLGYVMLQTIQPVPVKPSTTYESLIYVRLLRKQFGAQLYFCNQDYDAAGAAVYPVHYSFHHFWDPLLRPAGEWQRHAAQWTSNPQAGGVKLRFLLRGTPSAVVVDDLSLTENPVPQVHPARVQNSEQPFDEARSRANLARRTPQPARVVMVNNKPEIAVGNQTLPPLIHNGSFFSPFESRFGNFGRCGIHLHTVSCELGPTPTGIGMWDKYPGALDFSRLEKALLRVAGADPEAQALVLVRVEMPRQWGLDHPEDVWTLVDGRRCIGVGGHPDHYAKDLAKPDESYAASYGSPRYQQDVVAVLQQLGQWLRTADVGKIVVGFMIAGGNDGQFFPWNWGTTGMAQDHSPGQEEGFRRWLRERYDKKVKRLQEAWADPQATFETAKLAPDQDPASDSLYLPQTGPGRWKRDSLQYFNEAPALAVRLFARTLKQALGRPAIALTYYPDAIGGQASNKYALSVLLDGSDIDGATAVQEYGQWRALGSTGGTNATWGHYRLNKKIHIAELDNRSFLSGMASPWDEDALGVAMTAQGFRDQILRDIAASAARGMGAWFYDMGGIWYDDPKLWPTIAEAARVMAWAHDPAQPAPQAEMAVFVDEALGYNARLEGWGAVNGATGPQRLALNLSGVPYDLYLLQDVTSPYLPSYRVNVFLTAATLTKRQAEAIEYTMRRPGKTVVFMGAPGGASADFPDPAACAKRLTGLSFGPRAVGASLVCLPDRSGTDPLTANLPDAFPTSGAALKGMAVCNDPGATVLGRYADDKQPSHVVARTPRGTVAWFTPGSLTPELLHNLAVEAGIRVLGRPGHATYVGCGVAAVHRCRPGEAQVDLGAPLDLFLSDPRRRPLSTNVTSWRAEGQLLETPVVLYRPHQP